MRVYLVTVTCLGERFHEVRAYRHACDAVIDALSRYPRQCGVCVRRLAA